MHTQNNLAAFQSIRKQMPAPTQVMGERKRKNAYRRTEKHKRNFLQDSY